MEIPVCSPWLYTKTADLLRYSILAEYWNYMGNESHHGLVLVTLEVKLAIYNFKHPPAAAD